MQNTSCSMDMYLSTHTGQETNVINKQAIMPAVWTAEDASCNTHTHSTEMGTSPLMSVLS